MQLVDTHTHIYQDDFKEDIPGVLERARMIGINRIFLPNVDLESIEKMHKLCDTYPQSCFPMMGLHPTSVGPNYNEDLKTVKSQFSKRKYIAVGEVGLDLYWDKTYIKEQIEAFEEQLRWCIEFQLPVVIHSRDAISYVIESIRRVGADKLKGVFHSFGGSESELKEILLLENFMLGINGVVTFKKSEFRNYLSVAPIEKILLETDAPYLSPEPYRGKRNEPSFMLYTCKKLAEIYHLELDEVAEITTSNALRLFNFQDNF